MLFGDVDLVWWLELWPGRRWRMGAIPLMPGSTPAEYHSRHGYIWRCKQDVARAGVQHLCQWKDSDSRQGHCQYNYPLRDTVPLVLAPGGQEHYQLC